MAAISEIEGDAGEAFLKKLHSSNIFEIAFPARETQPATTIRFPVFLVCQTSTRFREANDLSKRSFQTTVTLEWIFGSAEKLQQFESLLTGGHPIDGGHLIDLFRAYVEWLYTGKVFWAEYGCSFYDIMRLAEVLGAPKMYNAALRNFCLELPWNEDSHVDNPRHNPARLSYLEDCMASVDLTNDIRRPWSSCPKDPYWNDKKRLLFTLDCAAWEYGQLNDTNSGIADILRNGGDLAALLGGRLAYYDGDNWARNKKCIDMYLIDETLPDDTAKDLSQEGDVSQDSSVSGTALLSLLLEDSSEDEVTYSDIVPGSYVSSQLKKTTPKVNELLGESRQVLIGSSSKVAGDVNTRSKKRALEPSAADSYWDPPPPKKQKARSHQADTARALLQKRLTVFPISNMLALMGRAVAADENASISAFRRLLTAENLTAEVLYAMGRQEIDRHIGICGFKTLLPHGLSQAYSRSLNAS
ncbi:hypothetical protein VTL71DRAFT_7256 [Oculimacula yallundae]|uniref:Uncharacterized protein n=1 Tax=Oculimacula yallundae TaxID=86028 RepID=A0ABR4BW92_9HELO